MRIPATVVFLCYLPAPLLVLGAADQILLDCGADMQKTDPFGRLWTLDNGSKFSFSAAYSIAATAAMRDPSVPQVPYMTARIFPSNFTYRFPVSSGWKFVRLYFYPSLYKEFNASDATFSVFAGNFTLLLNFNVAQTTKALKSLYVLKEYSVNVAGDTLDITLSPSKSYLRAFAFVNGIEVVSMPDIYSTTDATTMVVGLTTFFTIDNTTALENVYRLNVGGQDISPSGDSGLFRSWYDDTPYIYRAGAGATTGVTVTAGLSMTIQYPSSMPTYVAPIDVYSTARSMGRNASFNQNHNLTWIFPVDSGFNYLIRLHFCELDDAITTSGQRMFAIFIGNQTAQDEVDVAGLAKGNGIPYYMDYVAIVPDGPGQQDLWLALHPDTAAKPLYYDTILNGLEIFKVSHWMGNLAGPNPISAPKQDVADFPPARAPPGSGKATNQTAIIAGGVSGGVVLAIAIGLLAAWASRRRRHGKDSSASHGPSGSLHGKLPSAGSARTNTTGNYASSLPSNLCRHFSFAEIKAATNNFDEALLIGSGGFGKVYKGEIDGTTTKVAVKRGNPLSQQGVREFQTEIEVLSKLRHRHLVSLIGYCEENCEMILVYDYMANGTLREHLCDPRRPPLPWKQRLEICIGAARGLHYLHTGSKRAIIHRDVKSTNILLDEEWVAKVSDFGLSKTGPTLDHTHVTTAVKGSFGYLDPEYFRRQQLTDKSDVYSFGVVLLEILCGRPALSHALPEEQVNLAEWATQWHKKGNLQGIMDPHLKGKIETKCFRKIAETAMWCVTDRGLKRPSMGEVLWTLEAAMRVQERAEKSGKGFRGVGMDAACKGKKVADASPSFTST